MSDREEKPEARPESAAPPVPPPPAPAPAVQLPESDRARADTYALLLAQRAFVRGDATGEARADLEQIIQFMPDHALSVRELARLQRAADEPRLAAETLAAFLGRHPERVDLLLDLALLARDGVDGEPVRRARAALRAAHSTAPAFLHLEAEEALRDGRLPAARDLLVRALEGYPGDGEVRAKLVKVLYLLGDFAGALEAVAPLAASLRTAALTRVEAVCLFYLDRHAEAARLLESVLLVDPEDLFALYYLADIEERRGRGWKSDRALARLVEKRPAALNDRALSALARIVLNDPERADQLIKLNLGKDPDHAYSHFVGAVIDLSEGRFSAAAQGFALTLELDPHLLRRELRLLLKSFRAAKFLAFVEAVAGSNPALVAFFRTDVGLPPDPVVHE